MPNDPRDYRVDIPGITPPEEPPEPKNRPYLSIHFRCCGVYCRIYRNKEGSAYVGGCPKCGKPVRFLVGYGGTEQRSFEVE